MKIKNWVMIGAITAAIGIGAVAFNTVPKMAEAATSSSSSTTTRTSSLTPGNLVYLNIKNATDPWYGTGTYQYAFKFFASATDTTDNWSAFAARAAGGDRFYCSTIPSKDGVTIWYGMRVYCFLAAATNPKNDSPIAITNLLDASGLPVNQIEVAFGPNKTVGTTASPAAVALNTADNTSYSDSSVSTNKLSIWANYFCGETKTVCSQANNQVLLDYYWPTYSSAFAALPSASQTSFTSATALATPDFSTAAKTISSAAGRYDYLMTKYASDTTINDFANRSATKAAAVVPSTSDSSASYLLGGLAVVSALAAGSYFFIRKKKRA